jgi:hypothetical protein
MSPSNGNEGRPLGTLKTRWASEVSGTLPLPEHPRPQMRREAWGSLNGPWEYAIQPAAQEPPERYEGKILVPFPVESQLSGVQRSVGKENRLWYRRTFSRPPLVVEQRLLLHFGAVDWHAIVWVSGRQVGEHKGGYDPFTFDVTDALADGEEQTLVVSVWDPSDEGSQPCGKQKVNPHGIWYTPVTGIWQTVWWEVVPAAHIARLVITPDVDRRQVRVAVQAAGGGEGLTAAARLLAEGREVARAGRPAAEPMALTVEQPRLWSPDSPFLYDLEVRLLRDGQEIDRVESYCALRKIALVKDAAGWEGAGALDRIALNDRVLFQCGPLDQGWWPDGLYTAPTDEALRYDLEITKQLGFNAARKHVKVEPARWYYWADRLGLMVWQDMPNAGPIFMSVGGPEGEAEPAAAAQFRAELQAMIDARYNHPSIVVWVPFNEGWGQHDTNATLRWVKEYDPTRLVNGPSGWTDMGFGDLYDLHRYPGPGMYPPAPGRATVLGEFGGIGRALEGHLWKADQNWGYQNTQSDAELQQVYERLYQDLALCIRNGLAAAIYTQLTDVEVEVNGLLTYDRAVIKFDAGRLAALHRGLYAPVTTLRARTVLPAARQAPQQWRYTIEEPGEGWERSAFDDSGWQTGSAPFGNPEAPLFRIATPWSSETIWLRRRFALTMEEIGLIENLHALLQNNDNATLYLNGVEVSREKGHSTGYRLSPLGQAGRGALREGENLLAVRCEQKGRRHFIDVGLVDMRE